jgi:hypothetical protein
VKTDRLRDRPEIDPSTLYSPRTSVPIPVSHPGKIQSPPAPKPKFRASEDPAMKRQIPSKLR